jgi:hypothetical protein
MGQFAMNTDRATKLAMGGNIDLNVDRDATYTWVFSEEGEKPKTGVKRFSESHIYKKDAMLSAKLTKPLNSFAH